MRFAIAPPRHQVQAALLTCLILAVSSWTSQQKASRGVRELLPVKIDAGGDGLPVRWPLDSSQNMPSKYAILSASSPVEQLGRTAQSATAGSVGPQTDVTQPAGASEIQVSESYTGTADGISQGEALQEGGKGAPGRDGSDVGDISQGGNGGGEGGDGGDGESEGGGGGGSDEYEDVRWLEEVMRPAWAEALTTESPLKQHQQSGDGGAPAAMRPPAAVIPDGLAAGVSPPDGGAAAAAGLDAARDGWPLPTSALGGLPLGTTSPSGGAEPGAASDTPGVANGTSVEPEPLHYPVWWMAPFWSGSGYSSEAINYVLSLTRANLIWFGVSDSPRRPLDFPEWGCIQGAGSGVDGCPRQGGASVPGGQRGNHSAPRTAASTATASTSTTTTTADELVGGGGRTVAPGASGLTAVPSDPAPGRSGVSLASHELAGSGAQPGLRRSVPP
ncbi:hypothetical protein VaNZ11_005325 [Volvox africanus]|uniref:Uncharacterized protein n=1 Tax=Volvox africanus TaxID=51714 RepID=A0ABQ5RZL2_9CHLO|nr:hypothetical protein VaNZ11_005325 [Volvox africanus]